MFNKLIAFAVLALLALSLPALAQVPVPGEIVTFAAEDGTELSGVWRGTSDRVVILSHQTDIRQEGWDPLVAALDAAGYATFTYNFRGQPPSGGVRDIKLLDNDLRGAIAYAQARGAAHLTLVGASMGGIATVVVAAQTDVDAYVIIAAPRAFGGLAASDEALQASTAAKLFINSERDHYNRDTRHMAEAAAEPKTLSLYPGSFHGLLLLKMKDIAGPLTAEIVAFIETNMPQ